MAVPNKDTIYIDIDEEITGIIDKLRGSSSKVVAIVLPKRAAVLQSVVNMKLLKRAADETKKSVVLITSETGLLPLAGLVGMHVAKTLNSKPEIPMAPVNDEAEEQVDEDAGELGDDEVTSATAGDVPVGALAGLSAVPKLGDDDVETIDLDDEDSAGDEELPAAAVASKTFEPKDQPKKDKKLAVPNFEKFRLLLILGGVAIVALIIVFIFANSALAKATINIQTDATNVNASANITLSTAATTLSTGSTSTLPAKLVTQQKTYTQEVTTTGSQNNGQKATGNVTITNCSSDGSEVDIPAGTGVSVGGKTYITEEDADLSASLFRGRSGDCQSLNGTTSQSVGVSAQTAGSSYNTSSGQTATVAGFSDVQATTSSAISGGTDNIVQVVAQSDIDNAKGKINISDSSEKTALNNQLESDNYYPIPATYSAGTPSVTTSSNVGDAANSVTVTETVTYTMFGVHESDLKTVIDNDVKTQIDTSKQSILDEGLDKATFTVNNSSSTSASISVSSVAIAGPQLDENSIKSAAAGKKSGAVKAQLQSNPDVTGVTVKLSPFWVTSVPKKTSKITVNIAKPTTTASSSNASNP